MTRHYILEPDHSVREVSWMTWAEWFERNRQPVAKDETRLFCISTIFIGIDYSGGPPLLFETMVFEKQTKIVEMFDRLVRTREAIDQVRWSTWDEAVHGHEAMVRRFKHREAKAIKKANQIRGINHE
jgi:hypothetical protein